VLEAGDLHLPHFALAIHELATNAAKCGALSNATGWVDISWSADPSNDSGTFSFLCQEHAGPAVTKPERRGFGSTVLEIVMGDYFGEQAHVEFASSGVIYQLTAPLDVIIGADGHTHRVPSSHAAS
jgi:two-component sensor histidine kinase